MSALVSAAGQEEVRTGSRWDAVVAIGPTRSFEWVQEVSAVIETARAIDAHVDEEVTLHAAPALAGGRLIVAPTGPLARDYDDVRRFADAGRKGIERARAAGAREPLLIVAGIPQNPSYEHALEVALLGSLAAIWQPLEAREALGSDEVQPITRIGFVAQGVPDVADVARRLRALEAGRAVARDICGTEPERMAPQRMAEYCRDAFAGTNVGVEIVSDQEKLRQGYPLIAGVGRASMQVERHHPRVIRLEYAGDRVERTLLLAGKGLVYDTGGADLKVGGHMAGMSRDKGGGAAVAGFLKTVAELAPTGVRVVAEIGAVRNSIGADSFVSDEILRSHSGARVRIGNTDAEGRLVLADLLSHLRERAVDAINPALFSLATLTGHAALAAGPYTIAIENGPARDAGVAARLFDVGEIWGDPFEISHLRREDWDFVKPRTRADDVLSCNNAPSSQTTRGHQFPMAFLCIASGLERHGRDGDKPLAYTHLDVAGSAVEGPDWQHGKPSGAPIVALAAAFLA
ncbi:MAG: leucyl aminopeptidase family protein [Candidatus Latescibacterota bacterium]|nr:MAG: leucyl aminopeptidase family protein [Candidatus Latescibacterota bacterium]